MAPLKVVRRCSSRPASPCAGHWICLALLQLRSDRRTASRCYGRRQVWEQPVAGKVIGLPDEHGGPST
jgi:hypothetical protein